jgi:hypothetical protein
MARKVEKLRDLGQPELAARERELAEQVLGFVFS